MNHNSLIFRNIILYKSFYRLIAIAVMVAIAVIIGSLVVGDSVRSTLLKRVEERLGKTETIIFARYSYLDEAILASHSGELGEAQGILLSNGFVSISGKLIPVMVWGTDNLGIKKGQAKINNALFNEIKSPIKHSVNVGAASTSPTVGGIWGGIVLHLPSAGMVPLGSMFVTDSYTTSLRLELDSVISAEQGGNLNLKNEQTIPFNIFVNRKELAEAMDVSGKINVILSDKIISKTSFAAVWNYTYSGLNVETENAVTLVTSDRIFIQDKVVETLTKDVPFANRIFTYLANSIAPPSPSKGGDVSNLQEDKNSHFENDQIVTSPPSRRLGGAQTIPYSFITAIDFYKGKKLKPDEIILSDYAAKRLNVRIGDTVSISYFISKQFKTLVEDSVFLKVGKIVPLEDLQADNSLKAEFPGLSNVEKCTDWNSDLPINMNLITDEDENYWRKYKNTPKAIVPYSTLASRWENAYGDATALHISHTDNLDDLTYEMFDIQLIYPREGSIAAAKSGVDFSSLFLSLGFFIIISAAMLMMVPLSEMLFRRQDELNLLKAMGFPNKRILRLLWRESTPIVFISAIVGVIVGLAYTHLVLFLLGTVWKGATHTEGFNVYPDWRTLVAGMSIGIIFSMLLLYVHIFRTLKTKKHKSTQRVFAKNTRLKQYALTIIFLGLLIINIFFIKSPILFVCTGVLFLFISWTGFEYLIHRGINPKMPFNLLKGMWSSLFYAKKQAMLSFITLASGVFIVFSVGLNRQGFADSAKIRTATGGFSLWCETSVPVYHNIQTEEGRNKLALSDLPKETQTMQLLKYSADDASCLNLNKVITPNVLGIDMDELKASGFKITTLSSLTSLSPKGGIYNCSTGISSFGEEGIPALVDETVLTWSLGKKLGDTIVYMGEKGKTVSIQLAGTIQNSIFQGYILIDKSLFSEIWSEISGSEILLIKIPDEEIANTKMLVSQALNNYGVRIMTTNERFQLFYSVSDTYLTIFLTLGGLGLLLGIFSFIIVVRKNTIARMKEITLYRSLGFDEKKIRNLLYKENIIIPLYAISTGVLGSLLGVSMGFGNVSVQVWGLAVVCLAMFIFCVLFFIKISVRNYMRHTHENIINHH